MSGAGFLFIENFVTENPCPSGRQGLEIGICELKIPIAKGCDRVGLTGIEPVDIIASDAFSRAFFVFGRENSTEKPADLYT
ncbi:MAG: hypothetical protein KBA91_03585, partial [Candidatus Moranbacteria bacterium]|nr:hypothetical protein [Candidatus Moranbacteria bacterium]